VTSNGTAARVLRRVEPLLWLTPSLVLIGAVIAYPVYEMVHTSLSRITISGLNVGSVGLQNYRYLFQESDLGKVIGNTAIWVAGVVGVSLIFSLLIAQLLNERFPGRRLVRWALIVPWAASLVMTAIVWKWMLNYYYGIVNPILQKVGIISGPHDWLGDPGTSFYAMVLVGIVVSVPFTTYVILAGLQGIPQDLYEAAKVDGANAWRAYRTITMPLLRPALLVAVVLNIIYVFTSFPIVWIMTQGGPGHATDTAATYVYKLAFKDHDIAEAAAMSVLNVMALLVVVVAYVVVVTRRTRRGQA
jgi:multiple sugar transport system permease protein